MFLDPQSCLTNTKDTAFMFICSGCLVQLSRCHLCCRWAWWGSAQLPTILQRLPPLYLLHKSIRDLSFKFHGWEQTTAFNKDLLRVHKEGWRKQIVLANRYTHFQRLQPQACPQGPSSCRPCSTLALSLRFTFLSSCVLVFLVYLPRLDYCQAWPLFQVLNDHEKVNQDSEGITHFSNGYVCSCPISDTRYLLSIYCFQNT